MSTTPTGAGSVAQDDRLELGRHEIPRQKVTDEPLLRQLATAIAANQRDVVFDLAAKLVADQPHRDLLSLPEVAEKLRVSERTLWRVLGVDKSFPKPTRVGRARRWRRLDIDDYLARANSQD